MLRMKFIRRSCEYKWQDHVYRTLHSSLTPVHVTISHLDKRSSLVHFHRFGSISKHPCMLQFRQSDLLRNCRLSRPVRRSKCPRLCYVRNMIRLRPRTKSETRADITATHDDLSETDTQSGISEEANAQAGLQKRKVRVCTGNDCQRSSSKPLNSRRVHGTFIQGHVACSPLALYVIIIV